MALTILVAGLLEHDSGKTWLGAALAKAAADAGQRTAAYKPVGGFNIWHSYWAFRESVERGTLAGGDALTYHRLLGLPVETVNPVALALAPPDPTLFAGPASYGLAASETATGLVLARLGGCGGWERRSYYFPGNLEHTTPLLAAEVRQAAAKLGAAPASPRELVEWLSSKEASFLLEECRRLLAEAVDVLVIESFNDAALPYAGLDLGSLDFYVLVAPGKALVYTGERLRLAMEAMGSPTARTSRITGLLGKPLHAEDLPPAQSLEDFIEKIRESKLASLLAG